MADAAVAGVDPAAAAQEPQVNVILAVSRDLSPLHVTQGSETGQRSKLKLQNVELGLKGAFGERLGG